MADVVGDAVTVAEGAIGISTWMWVILAALGLSAGGYFLYHHHVYEEGYDACRSDYKAAADKQHAESESEIVKIRDRYAKIDQTIQHNSNFNNAVSPLVANAIGRMPSPHPRTK